MSPVIQLRTFVRRLACLLVLGAAAMTSAACGVQVGAEYGYDDTYPPDTYIATTSPIYYEGRPTYYYSGRWYYRDGNRWAHYNREPSVLYQRRLQAPPARRNYDSWRGSPGRGAAPAGGWRGSPPRGAAPATRGGWRGDRH